MAFWANTRNWSGRPPKELFAFSACPAVGPDTCCPPAPDDLVAGDQRSSLVPDLLVTGGLLRQRDRHSRSRGPFYRCLADGDGRVGHRDRTTGDAQPAPPPDRRKLPSGVLPRDGRAAVGRRGRLC